MPALGKGKGKQPKTGWPLAGEKPGRARTNWPSPKRRRVIKQPY